MRALAVEAVARFPIRPKALHFIHHGENATFQVVAEDRRHYLLRVHRDDYHTLPAIQEELAWLALLSDDGTLAVPRPVRSNAGNWVETVSHVKIPTPRNCVLFEWIEGRFIGKAVKPSHLYKLGQLLGVLQTRVPKKAVQHRRYWTSDGLVGEQAKFGSIDRLTGVGARRQNTITAARKQVLEILRNFESRFPERSGLIHADLHFGNVLTVGSSLGAIDFDDCGHGFHAYDLVIPLIATEWRLGRERKKLLPEFRDALISGYAANRPWDAHDELILPYLITARRLLMLGWLNSRLDNPRLRILFKGAVERAMNYLQEER